MPYCAAFGSFSASRDKNGLVPSRYFAVFFPIALKALVTCTNDAVAETRAAGWRHACRDLTTPVAKIVAAKQRRGLRYLRIEYVLGRAIIEVCTDRAFPRHVAIAIVFIGA